MKKTIVSIALAALTAFSVCSFAACNSNKTDTSENTLIIEAYKGGYGVTFLNRLRTKFLDLHPGKNVVVVESPTLTNAELESRLKAGPKYNQSDLFYSVATSFTQFVAKGSEMYAGYDNILEDLSDVVNSPAEGETKLIKDKLFPEYLDYFTYPTDGKQYALPWATGANGIAYHSDVFSEKGWNVPKTTDELVKLCGEIKGDGWVPTTWPGGIGYWMYLTFPWWAQYEGMENYLNFFRAKDVNGNYSDVQFTQTGRLESMKVLEAIVGDASNSFTGSNSYNNIQSQMKFFDKEVNKIAMIPNGDWLENEMKQQVGSGASASIKMMRNPVISSITKKLTKVKTDAALRQVIDYVDGEPGAALPAGVEATDPDVARVREARTLTFSPGLNHHLMIPSYANAKDLAKDFLRLMYSDEGQQIFFEETGSTLPILSDVLTDPTNVSRMSGFQKSQAAILKDMKAVTWIYYYDPLFYKAGLMAYNKVIYAEAKLGAIGTDRIGAAQYIQEEYNWIHDRFEEFKINAGILS